jgi:hypothetical protein
MSGDQGEPCQVGDSMNVLDLQDEHSVEVGILGPSLSDC